MDWDDLHYILKVAETGDLSPAGRFLRVNAATVVRHIEALEEAPGRRLFVRTQRGYGLMEAGERLLQWSRRVEGEWDRPAVRDPLRHTLYGVFATWPRLGLWRRLLDRLRRNWRPACEDAPPVKMLSRAPSPPALSAGSSTPGGQTG